MTVTRASPQPASGSPRKTSPASPGNGAVLAENAASVYGFDLAELAEPASRLGPTVSEITQPLAELPENPNEALLANVA